MNITTYSDICKKDPDLRPYQQKAKEEIFEAWDEVDNVMFQMPTGTGKTRLFTSIISDINKYSIKRKEGVKILIVAHRTELIKQIGEHLDVYKVGHSFIAGGMERDFRKPVLVASIQTITNSHNREVVKRMKVQFIIIDEAHHALAASYKKLWDMYPDAKRLGVTATPWRMNHQSFLDLFDKLILSMPIKDFIKQNYLSPYKYYSLKSESDIQKTIDGIELDSFGEYKESSMEEKMDIGSIRAQLLDSYLSLAEGKRGIIYAINIEHAKHICEEYKKAGYKAVSIDSKTPAEERNQVKDKFKKGQIDIIVNVDIYSEGYDCPEIEFIQLARPTRSLVKYLQQVGRGLRVTKNKQNCIILDNVGMYSRFGLPDARRHWKYHFIGKKIDEEPTRFVSKGTGKSRYVDLSEGTEDMELIQDLDDFVETNSNESYSVINDFFPLFGVTLGKTTWKEAEALGGEVEIWKKGPSRVVYINNIAFWDYEGEGRFTSLLWTKYGSEFPTLWKLKGFSWGNSYDDWITVFKEMDFKLKIKKPPIQYKDSGRITLKAEFVAFSPDGIISFTMDFDFGEDGYLSSSPNTLYSFFVNYHGSAIDSSIDDSDEENYDIDEVKPELQSEKKYYDENGISYNEDCDILVKYPGGKHYDSIRLPEFITEISTWAFKGVSVSEIILHDEILVLNDHVFEDCSDLRTITMETNTPDDVQIDVNAFNWKGVKNCVLRVPFDALSEYQGDERFKDFKYITAIEGSRCLKYDKNGTEVVGCDEEECENIEIPEGVTSIKYDVFENNETIESVTLPNSLEGIGHSAFSGCSNLDEVELNEGLKNIGWDAFRGSGLSQIRIPDSVKEIGFSAFNCEIEVDSSNTYYCSYDGVLYSFIEDELVIYPTDKEDEEFKVPFTVEKIGSFAFEDTRLKTLILPETIKYMGEYILDSAPKLEKLIIEVPDPNEIEIDENAFESFEKNQCKLIVPDGSSSLYASNKHFEGFNSIREVSEEEQSLDGVFFPGQRFKTLPGTYLSEGKTFFYYDGCDHCYVVMSSKGFFLKVMYNGDYYYMSDLIDGNNAGKIWVKNKRGNAVRYSVAYSTDDLNGHTFGRFTESIIRRLISYEDLKTGKSFTVNLLTGELEK